MINLVSRYPAGYKIKNPNPQEFVENLYKFCLSLYPELNVQVDSLLEMGWEIKRLHFYPFNCEEIAFQFDNENPPNKILSLIHSLKDEWRWRTTYDNHIYNIYLKFEPTDEIREFLKENVIRVSSILETP